MKTYLVIRWNPGFSRARFATAKAQGLTQTNFDTVRVRLDGLAAIVSYRGTQPAEIKAGDILAGPFTEEEMRAYLAANAAEWEISAPPILQTVFTEVETLPANVLEPRKTDKLLKWLAAAAVAGGAYYAIMTSKGKTNEAPVIPAPHSESHGSGQ